MDDLDRVLEEVERLDREATPGPWRGASDHVGGAASGVIEAGAIDVARVPLRANRALIGCYRTTAPLLAAEVRRLRAELEETRLTLAAEQGRQEGAPSEGWRTDGEVWVKDYPDRTQAGVQPDGLWWRGEWHKPARWHGRANSRRAGMLAADAAAG